MASARSPTTGCSSPRPRDSCRSTAGPSRRAGQRDVRPLPARGASRRRVTVTMIAASAGDQPSDRGDRAIVVRAGRGAAEAASATGRVEPLRSCPNGAGEGSAQGRDGTRARRARHRRQRASGQRPPRSVPQPPHLPVRPPHLRLAGPRLHLVPGRADARRHDNRRRRRAHLLVPPRRDTRGGPGGEPGRRDDLERPGGRRAATAARAPGGADDGIRPRPLRPRLGGRRPQRLRHPRRHPPPRSPSGHPHARAPTARSPRACCTTRTRAGRSRSPAGVGTSLAVQIDHVVALADAWRTGAARWPAAERLRYANDPLVLLAVDGPANEAKADDDASQWLPPNRSFDCPYVARQVEVKTKYRLWVTRGERSAIAATLAGCTGGRRAPAATGAH